MYNELLTIESISLLSTIMVNIILIIVMLLVKDKPKNNYFLLGFICIILLWTLTTLLFLITTGEGPLISAKLIYIFGSYLPVFNILFSQTLAVKSRPTYSKFQIGVFITIPILMSIMVLIPGAVVKDVVFTEIGRKIVYGPLYTVFSLFMITYFSGAFWLMYKMYKKLEGLEKKQVGIVFSSIVLSTVAAIVVSLIMPILGDFRLYWAGSFFSGYTLLMIAYAIVRYGLFNIKIVATEFIAIVTWLLLFIKIFFNDNITDVVVDSVLLVLVVIGGVLIIKAVQKEKYLREKDDDLVVHITGLNDRLEKTNVELKELDEKKSEFMSLATHQLRAPLTAMKGYSSMILDGTFGTETNPEIKDAIEKISRSTTDLTMIVEDYLNISRIEQGSMKYNFSIVDVSSIVKSVVGDVKNAADRVGLVINLNYDKDVTFNVNVDEGKIKQVFLNIIDNAIKYTPSGSIDIYINKSDDSKKVIVKIQDTGVGIRSEVIPTLFKKYVRAPDASKINILGTGLGLYVAGEILKAHNARAWAESNGEGKGSTFYVEIASS